MQKTLTPPAQTPDQLKTVLAISTAGSAETLFEEWLNPYLPLEGITHAGVVVLKDSRCHEVKQIYSGKSRIGSGMPAARTAAGLCMLNNREISGSNISVSEEHVPGILVDSMNQWVFAIPVCVGDERYALAAYFAPSQGIDEEKQAYLRTIAKLAESRLNAIYWKDRYQSLRDTGKISMEELEKEFDTFRYSVSHDLRAPLRAIRGFTDILVEDHPELLQGEAGDLARRIVRNTDYMAELIHDLQEYYRAGKKELVKLKVPMKLLVEEVCENLYHNEKRRHISFQLSDIQDTMVDSDLMREVWHVLVSNAMKYTSKREKAIVEISSEIRNQEIVYCIKDNGVGFDPLQSGKLFNVFQRLHARKDYYGTGMGLAIAEKIVRRHGGTMWANGVIDIGAQFYMSLPLIQPVA